MARRDSSGNIYYYAEDFIGSSRVITQSNGTLCSDADFLPFGQEVDFTSACGQNYKFEGKERDIETGNDNFGARYYRSALGRWMSPDWSAIPAPVPYANLTNPQTLNLYAMTSDNPETFADLDGHSGILAMIADPGGSLSPDMATVSDFFSEGTGTISANDTPPPVPQQPTTTPQSPTGVAAQQQNQTQSSPRDPASLRKGKAEPDPNGNGGIIQHYQVVDARGRPVRKVSIQEHVKVLIHENISGTNANPNGVYYPTGDVRDQVGPGSPPSTITVHEFLKTEQTFTAYKNGHAYQLTTVINQYVDVNKGKVTAETVVEVP